MNSGLLIVGPYPPPFGGIASQLQNTAPRFVERGLPRVEVLSWSREERSAAVHGVQHVKVSWRNHLGVALQPRALITTWRIVRYLMRHGVPATRSFGDAVRCHVIRDRARRGGSGVVHFFMLDEATTAALLRRMEPALRLVVTVYGEVYDREEFFRHKGPLVSEILASCHARLAASRYCAQSVEEIGVSAEDIEPIYYGVDLDRFNPSSDRQAARSRLGLPVEARMVLFVGRMNVEMGVDVLREAIPALLGNVPGCAVVIVGARGPYTDDLIETAKAFPGAVFVRENAPGSDLPAYYAACDVHVAPTRDRHACMGMSIKEAMAAGRTSVCSRTGGIPEAVVHGATGVLLDAGSDLRVNPDELAGSVAQLLNDPGLAAQMGAAARARAELMFDNERTVGRLISIYRKLMAG